CDMAKDVMFLVSRWWDLEDRRHDDDSAATFIEDNAHPKVNNDSITNLLEVKALNRNHIWEITDPPKGRRAIGYKWVYKIKYNSNEEIERYKARLVAKGFSQREGVDCDETFSFVVKMSTDRCLIDIVLKNKWPPFQLDVNNAF
nr:ribonuclease H-like domain-containing protein [Tanacetum cinerariifolium]